MTSDGEDVPDEVLMAAAAARARAAQAPGEAQIRNLAAEAMARGGAASTAEIRRMLDQAIDLAARIPELLARMDAIHPQDSR